MNCDEYARMREVEDRHWWYRGLRALVWESYAALPREGGNLAAPATPPPGRQRYELPLLDIGCGTGGTLAGAPCAAVGIDRSLDALRFCRERGQRFVAQADAARLPFPDASFSGALLLDVLYHRAVPDPAAVLREAHRVIAPGGRLIVNVPAYNWLRSTHDEAIHTERRFTCPQLRALLTQTGFHVTRATYWNTLLFPAAAATRLLRRNTSRDVSDLDNYNEGVGTSLASAAITLERTLLRVIGLPFGLSVLAVGERV